MIYERRRKKVKQIPSHSQLTHMTIVYCCLTNAVLHGIEWIHRITKNQHNFMFLTPHYSLIKIVNDHPKGPGWIGLTRGRRRERTHMREWGRMGVLVANREWKSYFLMEFIFDPVSPSTYLNQNSSQTFCIF